MLKLILILMFPVLIMAEQRVGQYVIFTASFSSVALENMLTYAVDNSKDKGQPAKRVRWISAVSTNTSNNGLSRKNWRDNSPAIDSETSQIYMEVCDSVEGFNPIENFISQGRILKLGYYSFDRKGYNRDLTSEGNIYDAADRRNEWLNRWEYIVEISTP